MAVTDVIRQTRVCATCLTYMRACDAWFTSSTVRALRDPGMLRRNFRTPQKRLPEKDVTITRECSPESHTEGRFGSLPELQNSRPPTPNTRKRSIPEFLDALHADTPRNG